MITNILLKKLNQEQQKAFCLATFNGLEKFRINLNNKSKKAFSESISLTAKLEDKIKARNEVNDLEVATKRLNFTRDLVLSKEEPLMDFNEILRDKDVSEMVRLTELVYKEIEEMKVPSFESVANIKEETKEFTSLRAYVHILEVAISKEIYQTEF